MLLSARLSGRLLIASARQAVRDLLRSVHHCVGFVTLILAHLVEDSVDLVDDKFLADGSHFVRVQFSVRAGLILRAFATLLDVVSNGLGDGRLVQALRLGCSQTPNALAHEIIDISEVLGLSFAQSRHHLRLSVHLAIFDGPLTIDLRVNIASAARIWLQICGDSSLLLLSLSLYEECLVGALVALLLLSSLPLQLSADLLNHLLLERQNVKLGPDRLGRRSRTRPAAGLVRVSRRQLTGSGHGGCPSSQGIRDRPKVIEAHEPLWLTTHGYQMVRSLVRNCSVLIRLL